VPISHRRQKHREEEELVHLSSSRVEDAPQKPDCRSSPEQMNSRTAPVSEACSPYSCVRENRDGDGREQLNSELVRRGCVMHSQTRGERRFI
jgi:hypothetical protein